MIGVFRFAKLVPINLHTTVGIQVYFNKSPSSSFHMQYGEQVKLAAWPEYPWFHNIYHVCAIISLLYVFTLTNWWIKNELLAGTGVTLFRLTSKCTCQDYKFVRIRHYWHMLLANRLSCNKWPSACANRCCLLTQTSFIFAQTCQIDTHVLIVYSQGQVQGK